MRIVRIAIEGYGRLAAATLEFPPGLSIVMGPNERGKSTLRAFIADMLYGQKSNGKQRRYDESHHLHAPWDDPERYGGALTYQLADGREIEVIRNFDRKKEALQLFDRTHAREITADFELLKNREVDFAAAHLGVGKEVFLGAATISHFSLEELGDKDALNQIREKLLSLADSGDEEHSAEATLASLQRRIAAIGAPNARTKPLPRLRVRLSELEKELAAAQKVQEELKAFGETRRGLLSALDQLRTQRKDLETALALLEAHEAAAQLAEAESLASRIEAETKRCFALSDARDFPLDALPEVQRAENLVNTAKVQVARTRAERDALEHELADQDQGSGQGLENVPEAMESRFLDLSAALLRLEERIEENRQHQEEAAQRLGEMQDRLAELPDFTRLASDPVEWLTQLGSSFSMAVRSRDEECALRDKLRAEVIKREEEIAVAERLFVDMKDFPDQAREYELKTRLAEEELGRRRRYLETLEGNQREMRERMPAFIGLGILCGAGFLGLLITFFYTDNTAILVALPVLACAILYFTGSLLYARLRLSYYISQFSETQAELDAILDQEADEAHPIEALLKKAGAQNIRELEALYDQYRGATADLAARMAVLGEQEERAAENEDRVPKLLARLQETFDKAGEQVKTEAEVPAAVGNAISRYQAYREAKRKLSDCRIQLEKQQAEEKRLEEARLQSREVLEAVERDMRAFMAQQGFDHAACANGQEALRAYHSAQVQRQDRRGRRDMLLEKTEALRIQLRAEEQDLHRCERELERYIQAARVGSVEQWHTMADKAREYQQIRNKRSALQEQLDALLHGEAIEELRARAPRIEDLAPPPDQSREDLKAALEAITARIDTQLDEEHQVHIEMTQRAGGMRPLNELEEELAQTQHQLDALSEDFEATTYAMALIEDIARDKHARIAPRLAASASAHLAQITDGRYDELMISRDLTISVRIPQTRMMHENPEKSLSKGTVDQIYLALRLALVQGMSENGESLPMLLDDPFSNYDDARLERTLRLIQELANQHQVLVFTCREDVVRAANSVQAPVIRL